MIVRLLPTFLHYLLFLPSARPEILSTLGFHQGHWSFAQAIWWLRCCWPPDLLFASRPGCAKAPGSKSDFDSEWLGNICETNAESPEEIKNVIERLKKVVFIRWRQIKPEKEENYFSNDFTAVLDAVFWNGDVFVGLEVLRRRVDGHSGQEKLFQGKMARNGQDLASLPKVWY